MGGSEGDPGVFVEHNHLAREAHLDGEATASERDHARAGGLGEGLRLGGKRRHGRAADRSIT